MMNVCIRPELLAQRWLVLALLMTFMSSQVEAKPIKQRDIADTVAANPIMTSFASMIQASDLGTFLSSRGPFTLFVPTDSAFAKLPPGWLDTLLRPENKVRLQNILLFHIVNGRRLTGKDLTTLKDIPSCEGNPLTFKTNRLGTHYVLKAKVIHADIKCANGIINEIDTVLMPPEASLPPIAPPPPPTPPVSPATNTAPPETATPPPAESNTAPTAPVAPTK